MPFSESSRLQAYFDGELDAPAAAEVEEHLQRCAVCRAHLEDLEAARVIMRAAAFERAPAGLRDRVLRELERATVPGEDCQARARHRPTRSGWRSQAFWAGASGGAVGTALAAGLAFFLLFPAFNNPLVDELVGAHVRSLMPSHLFDVVSTDQHTVKPWFAGHADVAPVVADFKNQGYTLAGGRVDYVDHRRSAVTVYQHGRHVINVFSWAAGGRVVPATVVRDGYRMVFWRVGDLEYCAVSDTGWDELRGLMDLLRNQASSEAR